MNYFLPALFGLILGHLTKRLINWLGIDDYSIKLNNIFLELMGASIVTWSFINLNFPEALIFSIIAISLTGISIVDYFTFEIPIVLIIVGILSNLLGIFLKVMTLSAAIWGIFVGAVIPLAIIGALWIITKRQGMGFGDIQLGIVLGAWLGPMRMALTLFGASVLSLFVWIGISLLNGFDKDRALPYGPFLSFAGTGVYIGSFYYPEFFHLLIIY